MMKDIEEKIGYLKEHICNKDGDKDYLFISYKSTDKELVLGEIVYKLVYDYGLNVYFDGDFDKHNEDWIEQFETNMGSEHCRGIIAFKSMEYLTSYATLLELLYPQTAEFQDVKENFHIYDVCIYDKNKKMSEKQKRQDIGLKTLNKKERENFYNVIDNIEDKDLVNEIKKRCKRDNVEMPMGICYKIFSLIEEKCNGRETIYDNGNGLDKLCDKIKNDLHESVFSEETNTKKEDIKTVKQEQKYIEKPADSVLKSGKKKSYGTYDFMLYGEKYENYKLKNVLITTFKEVINKNLDRLDILINQINCLQEGDVLKNKEYSSVFRAGEVVKFNGKEVTIGTSLNKEAVFNYINKLIELCGEDKEIFKDMTSSGTV